MKLPKSTYLLGVLVSLCTSLAITGGASAHVVVKPAEVGVGSYQTFTTNVPVEKDIPTVGVRLVIPDGLNYVQPDVKPGWTIDEKTTGGGDFPTVTEISWTGGSIPVGQRDEFNFAAQAPAKPTALHWKAYQTYADGSVVAWDQTPPTDPKKADDDSLTPYSQTKVIDDLAAAKATKADAAAQASKTSSAASHANMALVLAAIAVLLSLVMLARVAMLRK